MAGKSFVFRFDDVEVREREFTLIKSGKVLTVEPKAFRTLLLLLHNSPKLISKEELLNSVWGDAVVTEGSLTRCIWLLRSLLGDDIRNPRYIETVATVGYRFVCKVEVSEDISGTPDAGGQPDGLGQSDFVNTTAFRHVVAVSANSPQIDDVAEPTEKKRGQRTGGMGRPLRRWLLPASAVLGVGLASFVWYLRRPLPPLRVTGYTQITHDGISKIPIGSDGTRLYLTVFDPPSIGQVALSGGEIAPVQVAVPGIAHPLLMDISPDGSSFLVVQEYRHYTYALPLWNVRALGDSVRPLGSGYEATFSPDGKLVAYIAHWGEIWVVRSDGTDAHKLASFEGGAFNLAWSPDGTTIRFTRGKHYNDQNSFWEMSADGSNPHQLFPSWNASTNKCCGRWTSDGEFFLFQVTPPQSYLLRSEIWALDERRSLFRRRSTEPFQLTTGPIRWERPVPSKDGKTILAQGVMLRGELSRFDSKTGQFQPFLRGISAQGATFSRDGKFVAYVSYPEGTLWKANADGSHPIQLTDPPLETFLPRWSPDGTQISFSASDDGNYIVPSEGGTPRRLVPVDKNGYELIVDWSPDGRKIVFSWSDTIHSEIRILDLDSRQVTSVPGSSNMFGARWSPDGRYLVAGGASELSLNVFDFKTQRWSTLPQKGMVASPEWSRDSKSVYFRRPLDDRGIFRIRIAGGPAERIVDLKDWHDAGLVGRYMGLDPTDAPLLLRDIGREDIYALTLDQK
jgi:Tol biopolymer transport system component/DNA-binding winged helix-turn-helix (wHTH) protein